MRSRLLCTVTGITLSMGMAAQAAVFDRPAPVVTGGPPVYLYPAWTQPRTPEARARDEEVELGLSHADRRRVQADLKALGFDPGPIDGSFGRLTRKAIWEWQYSMDHWASGYLTREQVRQLRTAARESQPGRYRKEDDRKFWDESGAAWGSRDGMRRYLERYPDGIYADYARDRLGLGDRDDRRRDEAAWREARDRDTARAYRTYLENYPDGRYAHVARQRLRDIRDNTEHADWDVATRADTVKAYRAFLRAHPNSAYAGQAHQRIRELQDSAVKPSRPADLIAFNRASEIDTISAYREFLRDYPNSRHVPEARRRLAQLKDGQNKPKPKPPVADPVAVEQSILKTEADMRKLIEGLRSLGYLKVQTGLRMTPEVRDAIRRLQRKIKKPQTGYVDPHVWSVIATASVHR